MYFVKYTSFHFSVYFIQFYVNRLVLKIKYYNNYLSYKNIVYSKIDIICTYTQWILNLDYLQLKVFTKKTIPLFSKKK